MLVVRSSIDDTVDAVAFHMASGATVCSGALASLTTAFAAHQKWVDLYFGKATYTIHLGTQFGYQLVGILAVAGISLIDFAYLRAMKMRVWTFNSIKGYGKCCRAVFVIV